MTAGAAVAPAAALAAVPIAFILVLMLAVGWSAARAGVAGLVAAVLLTPLFVGAGPGSDALATIFAGVFAEGGFTAASILWILWPALALHLHQQQCGAVDALRRGLGRVTAQPALQALLLGWFGALFFEGAAGFGTPVAIAAPLLVALGLAPVAAVVLALLGHAAGVSFGALGTPVAAQVALTGLDPVAIAWRTALLHALVGGVLMFFFVRTLGRQGTANATGGSRAPAPRVGRWAALAAASFLLPSLALSALAGPELATLGSALGGAALFVALLRRHHGTGVPEVAGDAKAGAGPQLGAALWPYAVLVLLVLATRAWAPLAQALGAVVLQWEWQGRFTGRLQPLVHPGTLLLVALVVGARLQRVPLRTLGAPLAQSARRLLPVTVALLAMLCLSRLMLHVGMIDALQQAAVRGLGPAWPLLAPAVGALGSFVTGSATASNVLFTSLQVQTAQALGLPVALLVAAQGLGAALGNIVCPHNIVAGAATVGLAGREAEVLRQTVWPCLLVLALGGAMVAALVRIEATG